MAIHLFEGLKKLETTEEKELRVKKIKPLEPLHKPLTISGVPTLEELRQEIESLREKDKRAISLFSKIEDFDFKSSYSNMLEELKRDIFVNNAALDTLSSNSSLLTLNQVNSLLVGRKIKMEEYHKRIEERFHLTTVDENYQYQGEITENSRWREEASELFPDMDLTHFTDLQLKFYVVALRTMPNYQDIIRKAMDPKRSPEHIHLLFNCLDDNLFTEILKHPEYNRDRIVSMMPSVKEIIEEGKKARQ